MKNNLYNQNISNWNKRKWEISVQFPTPCLTLAEKRKGEKKEKEKKAKIAVKNYLVFWCVNCNNNNIT